ncbi:MAG TPA: LysM peptidoglycan-binding domain-containing protein [Chitinophagaceae bacterium]|nr:LysM peptidoglycan-binding domain-containing protein [Chitinophagaceae bacterium]
MKNNWLLVLLCLLLTELGWAQENDLQVQGISPHLYLKHTVQAKDTWYSVARNYNVNPKQLPSYNGLTLDKPLSIGQVIKVPLTAENFSQSGSKAADEILLPVHHTLQEREWLYRVSVNYNKLPIETIEKWNNIKKEQAKPGMNLIVGYLKVKSAQSALAAQGNAKAPAVTSVATTPAEEKHTDTKPLKKPADAPLTDNADPALTKSNSGKPETKTPAVNTSNPVPVNSGSKSFKGGYFKTQYEESGKSISGSAGIFKSTSGWSDGKFYALVNNVPVGTIIKVNNPVSGRAIFAKVLGNLPEMKESQGLVARISDAGASELEAGGSTGKFSVELRW